MCVWGNICNFQKIFPVIIERKRERKREKQKSFYGFIVFVTSYHLDIPQALLTISPRFCTGDPRHQTSDAKLTIYNGICTWIYAHLYAHNVVCVAPDTQGARLFSAESVSRLCWQNNSRLRTQMSMRICQHVLRTNLSSNYWLIAHWVDKSATADFAQYLTLPAGFVDRRKCLWIS